MHRICYNLSARDEKIKGNAHDGFGQGVVAAKQAERACYFPRHDEEHAVSEAVEYVSRERTLQAQPRCPSAARLVTPLTKQEARAAATGNQGGMLKSEFVKGGGGGSVMRKRAEGQVFCRRAWVRAVGLGFCWGCVAQMLQWCPSRRI